MFLLDATHPKVIEKIASFPKASSMKFKLMITLQKVQAILADLGILRLYDIIAGPAFGREMEGIPDEITSRTVDFLIDGKYKRAMTEELALLHVSLKLAGETTNFGDLPVRIFTYPDNRMPEIPEETYQRYLKKGIDLRKNPIIRRELQEDYLNLSTDSKLIEIDGDHNSIYTKKENADIICKEVMKLVNVK